MEEIGKYVWINDEEFEWLPGKILEIEGDKYKIEVKKNDIIEILYEDKNSDLTEIHESCLTGVDDLLLLGDFNKQTLLHNTRHRFSRDAIYSFIGTPILIAVNPYKSIPIYNEEKIKYYKDYFYKLKTNITDEVPIPHLYHIAEAAYLDMISEKTNQCIIISGESGSGKTESTKIILKYLAVSSLYSAQGHKSSENLVSVEKQVLDSNPVLEAFGNAKTVRNNNSSRFGKFIQVNFTECGKILSAKIFNYLLEKSRIVKLQKEERNYHIFYQLINGADEAERKKFHLNGKTAEYFYYLNQSDCYTVDDENEKDNFLMTKECLVKLNFKPAELNLLLSLISGVLHLGNINFSEILKNGTKSADVDPSTNDFKSTAELLGVDREILKQILTIRKMKDTLSGKYIERNLSIDSAYNVRDAIAKQLYSKMFNWLVRRINDAISNKDLSKEKEKEKKPTVKTKYIGLLDIFGFENFNTNSFEQLCINYANERLQQYFNNHIFKLEQEEYKKEKIDWSNIEFIDNIGILNLIDDPKLSVFSLLDSEGLLKNCDDYTFRNKVYDNLNSNENLGETEDGYILIHHYAGDVYYDVEGFIEKNSDNVSNDIQNAMEKSKNKLIARLFEREKESVKSNSNKIQSDTLSKQFKKQLDELLKMLSQSNPRYVKCIKPNSIKKPHVFDSFQVGDQLLSAGVLEAIKIRRQGFSIRRNFSEFCNRYQQLTPMLNFKSYSKDQVELLDYRSICFDMIKVLSNVDDLKDHLDVSKKMIQIGVTKIFMKEDVKNALEFKLNRMKYIIRLQNSFRRYKIRRQLLRIINSIKVISKCFRGFKYRKIFLKIKNSTRIQRFYHHFKLKKTITQKLKMLVIEAKKAKKKEIAKISNNQNVADVDKNEDKKSQKNLSNVNIIYSAETDSTKSKETAVDLINALRGDVSESNLNTRKTRKPRQSIIHDLTNSNISNVVESELASRIHLITEELKSLKSDKEKLNVSNCKLKELNESKDLQIEVLEEKLKHMKEVVYKCEQEMVEINTKFNLSNKIDSNAELENEKLKEEIFELKREVADRDTQIEILNLNLNETAKKSEDLMKLNSHLKDQMSKRKEKDNAEVLKLLEEVNSLQYEKNILESKLNEYSYNNTFNANFNTNSSILNNFNTNSADKEKDMVDNKKQISYLKSENKNLMKKFEHFKSTNEIEIEKFKSVLNDKEIYINQILNDLENKEKEFQYSTDENKELLNLNKKLKELTTDMQAKINNLEKTSENSIQINQFKFQLEDNIRKKDLDLLDLRNKYEETLHKNDRHLKMEHALKSELKLKEIEIGKRNEIIKEIQEEMEKINDESIQYKKEAFNLKVKLEHKENEIKNKYESSIKNKNQEIFILKEKEIKYEKYIEDKNELMNKKQKILENKKNVNSLLVDLIKIKRGEVQCLEALKFTSSNNLKENLSKIRENEKTLITKIDDITNGEDYTDESDNDEDYLSENDEFNSSAD